jgi:thymidylate kinase
LVGKFFVIYGANNLGKTVQTRLLAQWLMDKSLDILTVKYPVYNLKPSGPKINSILRDPKNKNRNISEIEFQKLYIQNRFDFQPTIKHLLRCGINVVAEDYVGTGIAWGVTNLITKEGREVKSKAQLINMFAKLNSGLLKPDTSILLDGERFLSGKEKSHRNEDRAASVWTLNRSIYQDLANKYKWPIVNANQTIEGVHSDVLSIVRKQI